MKRTLAVTLVVGGLLFAIFTLRLGRQQQMLAMEEARAAEQRARILADAPPPVSLPGEQGGADAASPVGLPSIEPPDSGFAPSAGNKATPPAASDSRSKDTEAAETVKDATNVLKVFRLQNADAAEAFRTIQPLLPRQARVSVDQRTNSLILSADADSISILEALLLKLDEETTPQKARRTTDPNLEELPARRLPLTPQIQPVGSPGLNIVSKDDQDVAMDREAKQLAARVRAAKEPEKSKLRADLEKLIDKHFEHRQQRRNAEIGDMADRVDKLRLAHHRRQESKPDIIKRRLADLLDEENELRWDEARLKPAFPATQPLSNPFAASKLEPQSPNLDGEWLVTLPSGIEFVGKIEKQPEGCWSFREMRNLSGYYQLEGGTLKILMTEKKEPSEFEWLILNEKVMVLTKAPQHKGSDYRGATLRRGAKPKTSPERSQAEPASRSEMVLVAKLQKAEVLLKSARVEFERLQKLETTKTVSRAELDRATAQVEEAQADVDIAKAELEEARRVAPSKGQ